MRNIRAAAAAGLLVSFVAPASAQPPILHYDFEDQADPTDNLGTLGDAYDGDVTGNPTYVAFQSGFALQFDGTGDHVIPLGAESAFDIGDGNFALAATIQTSHSEPSTSHRFIITKQNVGIGKTYALAVRNDTGLVRFAVVDGALNPGVESSVPVNDGQPHELVGVRSGNLLLLFVDGALSGSASIPGGFGSTNNDNLLVIGGRTAIASPPGDFIGIIDNPRIFDHAILAAPIPAASRWSLIATTLSILVATTIVFRRERESCRPTA